MHAPGIISIVSTEHLSEITTEHQAIPFYRDERVLRWAAQIISAVVLIGLLVWVIVNFIQSANARGMALNFRFLNNPAGFPISDPVLPYDPSRTFGYAFLVGVVKTLLVSVVGIIFATILGTLIGLARLSSNWLLSRIALAYIEFHRNIPLLVLLFLWYFPVFAQFPAVEESITLPGPIYLNSRGIYLTWPRLGSGGVIWLVSIAIGIILAVIAWKVLEKRQLSTGKATYYAFVSLALVIIVPAIMYSKSTGSILETLSQVGSYFVGAQLGMFALGFFSKHASERGVLVGTLVGFLVVWYVAMNTDIAWPWYCLIGAVTNFTVSTIASIVMDGFKSSWSPYSIRGQLDKFRNEGLEEKDGGWYVVPGKVDRLSYVLLAFFFVMLGSLWLFDYLI